HGSLPPLPGGPGHLPPLHGGPGHIGPADQLPPLHHAGPPNPSAFDPLTHLSGLNSPNESNLANGLRLPDGLQGGSGPAAAPRGPDGSICRAPSLGGPGGLAGVGGLAAGGLLPGAGLGGGRGGAGFAAGEVAGGLGGRGLPGAAGSGGTAGSGGMGGMPY